MTVKAARPGESCIKIFLHVGGCHDNDALIRLKAVHLQGHGRVQESARATYSSQREGQSFASSSRQVEVCKLASYSGGNRRLIARARDPEAGDRSTLT